MPLGKLKSPECDQPEGDKSKLLFLTVPELLSVNHAMTDCRISTPAVQAIELSKALQKLKLNQFKEWFSSCTSIHVGFKTFLKVLSNAFSNALLFTSNGNGNALQFS